MPVDIEQFMCRSDNFGVLIRDRDTGATALIDAPEEKPILEAIERTSWTPSMILTTHHHIDHVYFTRPVADAIDFEASVPGGIHRWVTAEEMAGAFALTAPDGTVVPVAEDVRLLAIRAIAAAAAEE